MPENFLYPVLQQWSWKLINDLVPEAANEAEVFSLKADYKLLFKSRVLKDRIRIKPQTPERIEIFAGEGLPFAEIHNKEKLRRHLQN